MKSPSSFKHKQEREERVPFLKGKSQPPPITIKTHALLKPSPRHGMNSVRSTHEAAHGVLLLSKPEGLSSHDLVHKIRKLTGLPNVGHCGILDPMASGLMILLLGEGTKMSSYLLNQDKLYEGTLLWGITTDTLDGTGKILKKKTDYSIDFNKLKKEARILEGEHLLSVPLFSAMKIKGKRLYKYARQNQEVEIPKKKMCFYRIEILEMSQESCRLKVLCSKGSYIRSLVAVLGEKMGCGATLSQLSRLESRPYSLNNALTLKELEDYMERVQESPSSLLWSSLEEKGAFIPLHKVLPEAHALYLKGRDRFLMLHGQLSYSFKSRLNTFKQNHKRGESTEKENAPSLVSSPFRIKVLCALNNKLLALLEEEGERGFKIKRVFKY